MAKESILKGEVIDKEKDKINNEAVRLDKWTVMHGQYRRQITAALGAVSPKFSTYLTNLDCKIHLSNIQKTVLLGSARILRMVLDMQN